MNCIENINSDDALLLAYAAGELEGEQGGQFEARLAVDQALRQRAEALRGDYQQTMEAIASLDQLYRVDDRRSLRQVDQLIHDWETEQVQIPAPIPLYRWRPPSWSYAAAAVVALLIGFCFWWANNPPASSIVEEVPTVTESTSQPLATDVQPENSAADAAPVQLPLAFQDDSSENSDRLASLEHDVVALSNDQLSTNSGSGDTNQ